jgi:hypothetical protein
MPTHDHNLPTGFAHNDACGFLARVLLSLNADIGTWIIAIEMLLERHYGNCSEAGHTGESSFLIREQCLFGFAIELVAIDTTAKIRNVDLLSGRIELQTYRFVKVLCQDLCSRA